MALIVTVHIKKITTLADGGLQMVIETPDLQDSTKEAEILAMRRKEGIAAFSLIEISNDDLKNIDAVVKEAGGYNHSPSEHLRNTLYAYWTKMGVNKLYTFEQFYSKKMSDFAESLKQEMNGTGF